MQKNSFVLFAFTVCLAAFAGQPPREELQFETWEVPTPPEVIEELEARAASGFPEALPFDGIDDILNIGKAVWKVIEAGKPTLESKHSYATALPPNVKSAGELEHFSPLQFKSFTRRATSWYYGTAFEITYTLAHQYNGSYGGKGKYLNSVTVLPHKVDVSWAYHLDVAVEKISVSNLASKEDPIACVAMEFALKVSSWFGQSQYKNLYEFRGDSEKVRAID
jgi:hypothetical protein